MWSGMKLDLRWFREKIIQLTRNSIGSLSRHRIPFAIILLSGTVITIWFRGLIVYQWDTVFPFNPPAIITSCLWPWSDLISTGVPFAVSKDLPYFSMIYILHNSFGLSLLVTQESLYYFLLTLGGISMYAFFINQCSRGVQHTAVVKFGGLTSALTYMFNPYWMVYLWQTFSLEAFLYATLPCILLLF